jgi:bla regulator protein BlaR1
MIPGLVAHLWQSTLFAGAAWLLTLALRANRAHVRYWVWFLASAKFLLPFSLLVRLGALLPHHPSAPVVRVEWVVALQQFSQPLPLSTVPAQPAVTNHTYWAATAFTLWSLGFAAVAVSWLRRWRRVHALRRSARFVTLPTALPVPVPVMSAPDLTEPGIVGVFRPVLLLPERNCRAPHSGPTGCDPDP